jgi:hypothetical protein
MSGQCGDLGLSNERLDAFINGRTTLPAEALKDLARLLYHGHVVVDVDLDRLRPAAKPEPK